MLIDANAVIGSELAVGEIMERAELAEEEFSPADQFLLQQKYIEGLELDLVHEARGDFEGAIPAYEMAIEHAGDKHEIIRIAQEALARLGGE